MGKCKGQKSALHFFLNHFQPSFFRQGLPLSLLCNLLVRLADQWVPRTCPSPSLVLGIQLHNPTSGFHLSVRIQTHAYTAGPHPLSHLSGPGFLPLVLNWNIGSSWAFSLLVFTLYHHHSWSLFADLATQILALAHLHNHVRESLMPLYPDTQEILYRRCLLHHAEKP